MKGREGKGPPSADLLVCFPSRAHLTLMPKPICSPARPNSEPNKRHQQHQHRHHQNHRPRLHQHLRKSSNRGGGGGAGHASPLMWAKNKATSSEIYEEPTSPKVTCAGQIKVRPKPNPCKNWQSVMEEIERLHNSKKHKKRPAWIEALGFKKDIMQFLTCLRSIRFDFHCFGSFPTADITSEDDEEDEDDNQQIINDEDNENSRTVFSKWFMVLQENQSKQVTEIESKERINKSSTDDDVPCAPPPNALLLMRCRSAPAKSWLEEIEEEKKESDDQEEEEEEEEEDEDEDEDDEKLTKEEEEEKENAKRKENLVVMQCGADFYKISSDIAKETWVVGGIKDSLSRSRSSRR